MHNRLQAFGFGSDGPDPLYPARVAQPQGQSAASQPPKPDAHLQHRSELPSLGGDVCGASDPYRSWRIVESAFLMPPSVAKRTSQYF